MDSSEAKGGMASLAELANINFGGSRPAQERGGKKKKERGKGVPDTSDASQPTVEAQTETPTEQVSPEAAASPAEGTAEPAPTEVETEHLPEASEATLPEEVAPESGQA